MACGIDFAHIDEIKSDPPSLLSLRKLYWQAAEVVTAGDVDKVSLRLHSEVHLTVPEP